MTARAKPTTRRTKKASTKAKDKPLRRRASDRETEALRNELMGIVILAVSLTLLLCLVSFYPEDVIPNGLAAQTGETQNLIGPLGASIADVLLSIMGLAAFLLPATLAAPGICFATGRRMEIRPVDAMGYPVMLICASMAAHLWLTGRPVLGHDAGGWIGTHGAEIVRSIIGSTGAYILVYCLLALTFVMTTRVSLIKLTVRYGGTFLNFCRELALQFLGRLAGLYRMLVDSVELWWADMRNRQIERLESTPRIVTDRKLGSPLGWMTRIKKAVAEKRDQLSEKKQKSPRINRQPTPDFTPEVKAKAPSPTVSDETDAVHNTPTAEPVAPPPVEVSQSDDVAPEQSVDALPDEKPVVNRKKAKEQPVEQIEIPLPEAATFESYQPPPLHLLNYDDADQVDIDPDFLQQQAQKLVESLKTFRIEGRVTEIHPGPVVTMYEFEPAPGVRISKIAGLADDLAMALKAVKVRIVAPIPGKGVVGFEVPNLEREMVYLKEIIGSKTFGQKKHHLPIVLGKDIHGEPTIADLAKMPHLLVAGTTGSGKSVGVNCMITSLLYRATPEEVRFIMVDPKMLELSIYEGIPHLLLPVVTNPKKASLALKWAVDEMERRYEVMKNAGVRDLRGYNRKAEKERAEAEAAQLRAKADAIEAATADGEDGQVKIVGGPSEGDLPQNIPYIVVVIDEFADLMMVAGKEVEHCVARIAQKARAAGIHLILATQRPSTDVITGVIKANFPTRIAFQVSSSIDSRTILSTNGAENLLGKGDMLFMPPGTSKLTRVHGAFVTEDEIHEVVSFIGEQQEPQYLDESILEEPEESEDSGDSGGDTDPIYEEAVRVVARDGRASTSHLQRRLSLGYNRAARIVDQMEQDGLVGPSRGAKPREVNRALINELLVRWDEVSYDPTMDRA